MHPVDQTVRLGFGCFWFGVKGTAPAEFRGREYLDQIRAALEQISAVEAVKFSVDPSFLDTTFERPDPPPSLNDSVGTFPSMDFSELQFRLVIPARVQRDLGAIGSLGTDRFRVTIRPTYRVAVTMIECLDAPEGDSPSTAVRIVRELLRIEMERLTDPWIDFQSLGPSPAHVDVFLHPRPSTATGGDFDLTSSKRRGYRRLDYDYDSSVYPSPEDAANGFLSAVDSELDLLYFGQQITWISLREWDHVQSGVDAAVKSQRSTVCAGSRPGHSALGRWTTRDLPWRNSSSIVFQIYARCGLTRATRTRLGRTLCWVTT